ncbi:MAG: hypothetical protein IKX14_06735, partial [Neisseriaceae bacterium]|nr:hypothetical protein [Neisseriaceae bacterium]
MKIFADFPFWQVPLAKLSDEKVQVPLAQNYGERIDLISGSLNLITQKESKKMTFKPHILTAILTASLLSACTLAPNYNRPEVNAPVIDDNNAVQKDAVRAVETEWKAYFADPRLVALIDAALEHNTDLRLAVLN